MPHLREFGYEASPYGDPSPDLAHRRERAPRPLVELDRRVPSTAIVRDAFTVREPQWRRRGTPEIRAVA